MKNKPKPLAPIFENIPSILTSMPNWVTWKYLLKKGEWTKPPMQTDGSFASSTDPSTWDTFDNVRAAYHRR